MHKLHVHWERRRTSTFWQSNRTGTQTGKQVDSQQMCCQANIVLPRERKQPSCKQEGRGNSLAASRNAAAGGPHRLIGPHCRQWEHLSRHNLCCTAGKTKPRHPGTLQQLLPCRLLKESRDALAVTCIRDYAARCFIVSAALHPGTPRRCLCCLFELPLCSCRRCTAMCCTAMC